MKKGTLFLIGFLVAITGIAQQKDRYCKVCYQKIDNNNAYINGIPHQFYEALKTGITNSILNYKVWFGRSGSKKPDYLTPASRDQHGEVRTLEYLQWRDLLDLPDSIKKNNFWCLDMNITRFSPGSNLFLVERRKPYRLIELYNWGKKTDTFNLSLPDSAEPFDEKFLVYVPDTGSTYPLIHGVSGNIELESSDLLRLKERFFKDPPTLLWIRLAQFGITEPGMIRNISDTMDGGKYRLYSVYSNDPQAQKKSLFERGALVKMSNKRPYDDHYELIFFSNDPRYTRDPDEKQFYEIKKVWDFDRKEESSFQDRNIYPFSNEDTRWRLRKLGAKTDAEDYCVKTYGVKLWTYLAGKDFKKRPEDL